MVTMIYRKQKWKKLADNLDLRFSDDPAPTQS
jgi:hypothetical protein